MSNGSMSPKQKGYIGLGAMVVLSAATIWGTEPLYKFIDGIGKEAIYTAGTYTGKAEGFGGEVIANVTVSDTTIQSIELVGDGETPGIGTNALEQLPGSIMGKQSTEVDAVSGATVTSDAVKTAVDLALALARGEEITIETTAAATTAAETTAEETKAAETTKPAVSYSFTPGTYLASAEGYAGTVKVEVTVSETEILEVKVTGEDETPEIGGNALKKMPARITEAQSVDVDAVSGATVTSDAIIKAVEEALAEAQGESGGSQALAETEAAGAADTAENQWKAGTYTGEAEGYAGKVAVEVVITDAGIQEVKIKADDETPEIGGNALKKLPGKIVEAQSADVDAISGATITSDAVIEAVNKALEQARG